MMLAAKNNTHRSIICLNPTQLQKRHLYLVNKRLLDVLVSVLALGLFSPIFVLIAIVIKLETPTAKIFYTQERVGQDGQVFTMYKFRSMIPNADTQIQALLQQNEIQGAMFKMKRDPRVTPVGAFLRRYSLDELPQIINVLRGQMSCVGPRPPLPTEYAQYTNYDKQRLYIKPGCTGLWQVTVRNLADFTTMVTLDLHYIESCSIHTDLLIIGKTIAIMIKPNAAY